MNICNALIEGAEILKKNSISSAQLDSEILMSKAIDKSREYVLTNSLEKLDQKSLALFSDLIKSRSFGKPIAYLTKKKFFWKYEFDITEDVLIPRPDTEVLVESILKLTKNRTKLSVLDIGVGSGCLLLSIIKEKKSFRGVGIDVSKKCIHTSSFNAFKLGVKNKVKFFNSNIDNFKFGKYDLIISNPPYIKSFELKYLEKDIVDFEPIVALDGGLDGLSEIRKVIKNSSELIKKNGKLVLEIAFNQKQKVKSILFNNGFYANKIIKDLAGKDRCIISTKIK